LGDDDTGKILTNGIIAELMKIDGIVVIVPGTKPAPVVNTAPQILVRGSVAGETDRLRLHVQLIDPAEDAVIWDDHIQSDDQDKRDIEYKSARQIGDVLAKRYAAAKAGTIRR
jgi:TolB-like protein